MRIIAQRCSILLGVIIGGLLIVLAVTSVVAWAGNFGPQTWPGKTIKIYSSSKWNKSVPDGIRGINQVGLSIKLVMVKRKELAQIVISDTHHFRGGCAGGGVVGCAPKGYRSHSWVQLIPKRKSEKDDGSNAQLVMHELGHVLGLDHRDGGCKLMNPLMCDKAPLNKTDSGCPVQTRFGLNRSEWCSGDSTEYQMCRPTIEAARQLISLYGGHLPANYNPWCSHRKEKSWILDCAYPKWNSPHNPYPIPMTKNHNACQAKAPYFGWQGLGLAQRAARNSYIRADKKDLHSLRAEILRELYRLDRLAKDCPGRYCFPPLRKDTAESSQVRSQIIQQLIRGIDLDEH